MDRKSVLLANISDDCRSIGNSLVRTGARCGRRLHGDWDETLYDIYTLNSLKESTDPGSWESNYVDYLLWGYKKKSLTNVNPG